MSYGFSEIKFDKKRLPAFREASSDIILCLTEKHNLSTLECGIVLEELVRVLELFLESEMMPNNIYAGSNAVITVHNTKELEAALHTVLDKPLDAGLRKRMKRFASQHAGKQDGRATERVVKLIKEMPGAKT